MSYKFEYKQERLNGEPQPKITVEIDDDVSWPELMDAFINFLRACGFIFNSYTEQLVNAMEEENAKTQED